MSQGAEKSQLPEVGIEPGPQDLKANTLPRRCKSRLLPQGSRSVFINPYYIFPCFKKICPRICSEPRCYSGTLHPDARNTSPGPHNGHQMSQGTEKFQLPEVGIEPRPQDLKANTLPRRCKSRLLPQGSRSVFINPYYKCMRFPTTWWVCASSKASDQPAHTCSLIRAFAGRLDIL